MGRGADELHIVLPGLFTPPPEVKPEHLPRLPALEHLLARAWKRQGPSGGLEATLCALFGIEVSPQGNLPTAPFARLAEGGEPDDACWLHADPIFLRPDQDRVLLFDASVLALEPEEAAEFITLFNEHFSDDGFTLEAGTTEHWYLRCEKEPEVHFHPLTEVMGRTVTPFLPEGPQARQWRSLLNETQMLFFQAEINQRREVQGRLPLGGVWFHGPGRLAHVANIYWRRVVATNPLAMGLAMNVGAEIVSDMENYSKLPSGPILYVFGELARAALDVDAENWFRVLKEQERFFAENIKSGVRGQAKIFLYPGDGTCRIYDRRSKRRFWLRRRALSRYWKKAG